MCYPETWQWETSNMEYGKFYRKCKQEAEEEEKLHTECKKKLDALVKELEECREQLKQLQLQLSSSASGSESPKGDPSSLRLSAEGNGKTPPDPIDSNQREKSRNQTDQKNPRKPVQISRSKASFAKRRGLESDVGSLQVSKRKYEDGVSTKSRMFGRKSRSSPSCNMPLVLDREDSTNKICAI